MNLQYRHFPKVNLHNYKYPLEYTNSRGEKFKIKTPVSNLNCQTKCYTDLQELLRRQDMCKTCGSPIDQTKNFVDVGLAELINKNKDIIKSNGYIEVQVNPDKQLLTWFSSGQNLLSCLADIITDQFSIFYEKKKSLVNLNYNDVKAIIKNKFEAANDYFKPQVITWCKGNLKSDDNFSALFLNLANDPNNLFTLNLCGQSSIPVSFDTKNTHVHYIPFISTFIFLVSDNEKKKIIIRASNIQRHIVGSDKLSLKQNKRELNLRNWYSTTFDYNTNTLYILGGMDEARVGIVSIEQLKNFRWNKNEFEFDLGPFTKLQPAKICSTIISSISSQQKLSLLVLGGVNVKKNYGFEDKQLSKTITQIEYDNRKSASVAADFQQLAAYSFAFEIPKTTQSKNNGLIVFGGTADFQNDQIKSRDLMRTFYRYDPFDWEFYKLLPDEVPNNNFPYLPDNTAVIYKDTDKKYKIRALLAARDSKNKPILAYMLEYDVKSEKIVCKAINK